MIEGNHEVGEGIPGKRNYEGRRVTEEKLGNLGKRFRVGFILLKSPGSEGRRAHLEESGGRWKMEYGR